MSEEIALIRPATVADLEHFKTFAFESGPGITSLPRNVTYLEEMLIQTERSFASELEPNEKESYLFCLELGGKVVGSTGLVSRIGVEEPFFAFHKRMEHFASPSLNIEQSVPVLHFIEARKKPTEIGTLYLQKEFRGRGLGPLLSLSRFLFIALFRDRFASTVIAELRGVNREGISPLWGAIGRPFFGLDFSEADHLRITNPEAIRELFPRHPIYTNLLSREAQEVIGNPHPNTIPAKEMLLKQGFQMSEYVDIFDGGPHVYAPTDEITCVQHAQKGTIRELRSTLESEIKGIVSNTERDFRVVSSPILIEEGKVTLPLELGERLKVDVGDEILYYGVS